MKYSRIVTGQYIQSMGELDIMTAHKTKYLPGSEREREREREITGLLTVFQVRIKGQPLPYI